ncbi:hypothetical protein BFG52_10415 [Acinetobacter larvae]|uniref:Uncharacterized protein n=1 Tax=Acinetobacter larvae TaxID=1789224 RepID=A0A1B2M127_9GAMM|nr:hypothetical protein BFG52_10415 [Acinetobacter larvae]
MSGLIRKGGFRERANRSRRYQHSENHQTQLAAQHYQPQSNAFATDLSAIAPATTDLLPHCRSENSLRQNGQPENGQPENDQSQSSQSENRSNNHLSPNPMQTPALQPTASSALEGTPHIQPKPNRK